MDCKIISRLLFLIIVFTSTHLNAIEFKGKFLQGHFIVGSTDPNAKILVGKKEVKVSKDGYFVFGLDRDRKFDVTITKIINGKKEVTAPSFMKKYKENMEKLELDKSFLSRSLNEGFSGGEKKRNEMIQMLMLEPKLCILDETDSGLDVDALKTISHSIQSMRKPGRSFILITHYHRILEQLDADYVHILSKGKIVKTGTKELAVQIENQGFKSVLASE